RYEIRDVWVSFLKIVLQGLNKIRKKISWYSRGDYTTGANDTFACCRSDMASHITSGIKLKRRSFSSME
ncbi:hypothetical protein AB4423_05360, partial [Vibrio chagasii]|uniref:hypothetical protein n=1 Tax=Vibrio chagasii TaxID=170679 RepID=UPI00354DC719